MALYEICAIPLRLTPKSEDISLLASPHVAGKGHLTTANRPSQGQWSKNEAKHLDPPPSLRDLFSILFITNALLLLFLITLLFLLYHLNS